MTQFHLHLVSDSTGETLGAVATAALAQFEGFDADEHTHAMVRSDKQMEIVLAAIAAEPGIVMFTLVRRELRDQLEAGCRELGVPFLPVLDPVLQVLGEGKRI